MNKSVIITGAGSGIGQATAIEFHKNGWFCFLIGRDLDKLKKTASMIKNQAYCLPTDLADAQSTQKSLQLIDTHKENQISCLVNNAGVFDLLTNQESTDDVWTNQFQVNLLGSVRLTREVWKYFLKNKQGSIVNVSSTLGLKPTANTAAYSAIKAAMINWTQSLALEGGKDQIRANVVCPGLVDTPIHSFHSLPENEKQRTVDSLKDIQPLGRIGAAEEIARSIYFLGSEQSSWTTGAVLSVDGGINLK